MANDKLERAKRSMKRRHAARVLERVNEYLEEEYEEVKNTPRGDNPLLKTTDHLRDFQEE